MTIRIIVINDSLDKSVEVNRMTYHSWDMGKLGLENIKSKPHVILPKDKAEFYIWPKHMIMIEEKEDND